MISRLWPSTNPSMASKACCRPPGDSTERRDLRMRNRVSRNAKTSTSIAKELEMGASTCLGSMRSARRKAVTGTAKRWFRILVNQSCSIGQLLATSSWVFHDRDGSSAKSHGPPLRKVRTTLRRLLLLRARISPQRGHEGSRENWLIYHT